MVFAYTKHVQTNLIGKFDLFDQVAQTIRRTDGEVVCRCEAVDTFCICVSRNSVIIVFLLSAFGVRAEGTCRLFF